MFKIIILHLIIHGEVFYSGNSQGFTRKFAPSTTASLHFFICIASDCACSFTFCMHKLALEKKLQQGLFRELIFDKEDFTSLVLFVMSPSFF